MVTNDEMNDALTRKSFRRPFICTVVLSAAMTYFGILTLLFLTGIVFSRDILNAIAPYDPAGRASSPSVPLFLIAGTGLYVMISTGLVLFMVKRRLGFYLFLTATVVLLILDLIYLEFDWIRYLAATGFIFILGIMHFSGKCYPKRISSHN